MKRQVFSGGNDMKGDLSRKPSCTLHQTTILKDYCRKKFENKAYNLIVAKNAGTSKL
jgi:hypothetical protein